MQKKSKKSISKFKRENSDKHSDKHTNKHSDTRSHTKKTFIPLVIDNNRNIATSNVFDIENQIKKVPMTWNEYKKSHLSPTIKVDNSGYFPGGARRKHKRTKRRSNKSKQKTKCNR